MRVDLFLHGTPNGQNIYASSADKDDYVLSYYHIDLGVGPQSLIVETKVLNNNLNCYYTYFVPNVQDVNGRPGGYFAITLRFDTFVRNLQVMFQLLDIIYNQQVLGSILSGGNANKYLVQTLNEQGKLISDLMKNLLSQVIKVRNLVKLDDSFLGNSGTPLSYNPCDNRCTDLLTQYKSAERITISPSAPLPREQARAKEYQDKLSFVKRESEEKLKSEIRHLRTEIDLLQRDKKVYEGHLIDAEEKINVLKNSNNVLRNRLSKNESEKASLLEQANIKSELVRLSDPILRLNGLLQKNGISPSSQNRPNPFHIQIDRVLKHELIDVIPSKKSVNLTTLFSFISLVLLIVVFILQLFLSCRDNSQSVEMALKEDVTKAEVIEAETSQSTTIIESDFEDARINIREFGGKGPLQYNREYSLFISSKGHYNRPDTIKGLRWECDGGEIYSDGGIDARLRLKKKNGPIKIKCHFPNGESIVRVMEVSSNEEKKILNSEPVLKMKKDEKSIPSSKEQGQASYGLKG